MFFLPSASPSGLASSSALGFKTGVSGRKYFCLDRPSLLARLLSSVDTNGRSLRSEERVVLCELYEGALVVEAGDGRPLLETPRSPFFPEQELAVELLVVIEFLHPQPRWTLLRGDDDLSDVDISLNG